jgi:hypothetical protein
MLENNLKY